MTNRVTHLGLFIIPLICFALGETLLPRGRCGSASSSLDCSIEPLTGQTASEKISDCDAHCNTHIGSLFLPRPQGQNTAAFFDPYFYEPGKTHAFEFMLGYRYDQTFRSSNIARCLFGSETITFRGTQAPGSSSTMAENFGLSPNFRGQLHVRPVIKNHIIDFNTRVDFGLWQECFSGAYIALNASLAHSIWDLRACQTHETPTASDFSKFPVCDVSDIPTTIEAAHDLSTALNGNYLFGDMQSVWRYGKFELNHSQRATKLANIDLFLGYDFLVCDDYHVGLFVKTVAPTGTKPNGEYVFSPIIGNGHHWEFGGGLSAHYNFWNSQNDTLGCYLDGCVTHLFKDSQHRTFDFKCNKRIHTKAPFSRYILLKEFDENNDYTGTLINAVNFTTRKIKSSFSVQGDASLRLLYLTCGWAVGIGYNIFGRSEEKISGLCDPCREFTTHRYGIKGDSPVCIVGDGNDDAQQAAIASPRLISERDIKVQSIAALISHKIFAHVDYQWDESCYQPFIGIGGEAEFAQDNKCHVCTPNQWGIWVRGGLNY